MSSRQTYAMVLFGLLVLSAGTRFFRLGAYPFGGDETATFAEADSFQRPINSESDTQYERLPRLIPLAYMVRTWPITSFSAEANFGSRVMMAVLGSVSVLIVFWGLDGPLDRWTALSAALLVALWPEHVNQSQYNRFYITASMMASLTMVLSARAAKSGSIVVTLAACLAAFASLLTHTLLVVLLPGLIVVILAAAWLERRPIPTIQLGVVVASGAVTAAFVILYLLPAGQGWNAGGTWGYSPIRSMMGSVIQVGWPILCFAVIGAWELVRQRDGQGAVWVLWSVLWLVCSAIYPLILVYHPSYTFPLALGPIVLAGYGIGRVARLLAESSELSAWLWIAVAVNLQLPSLASHYVDGSRHDYRTAARYVEEHWQPGDRLASGSPGMIYQYAKIDGPTYNLSVGGALPNLDKEMHTGGRMWIVLAGGRGSKPEDLRRWLAKNARLELVVKKTRFDYYEFVVEVYLFEPPKRS